MNPIGGTWEFSTCVYPDARFQGAAAACFANLSYSCVDDYATIREQSCHTKGLLYKSLSNNVGVESFCICPSTGEQFTDSCPVTCAEGQHATQIGDVCVPTQYLGFADWCEKKLQDDNRSGQFTFVAAGFSVAELFEHYFPNGVPRAPKHADFQIVTGKQNGADVGRAVYDAQGSSSVPLCFQPSGDFNRTGPISVDGRADFVLSASPVCSERAADPNDALAGFVSPCVTAANELNSAVSPWAQQSASHCPAAAYQAALAARPEILSCASGPPDPGAAWCDPFGDDGAGAGQEGRLCGRDGKYSDGSCFPFPATDPNSYDPDTHSCPACADLHTAAFNGDLDGVNCNLGRGVNADERDNHNNNRTPLFDAINGNHAAIVSVLLDNDADVNAQDSIGFTPLHLAAAFGRLESMPILLSAGASLNAQSSTGRTPLFLTVENAGPNVLDALELLLNAGADPNLPLTSGRTPLKEAVSRNRRAIALRLIEAGAHYGAPCAPPDVTNPASDSPPCLDGFTVSLSLSAGGTVSVSWSGDSDVQDGEGFPPGGATVTFTALPEDGYRFSLWTGACADESDSPCVIAVTMDVTVGAEFELLFFEVSLAASPGGTVSAGWEGDADLPSGGTVPFGARVTFTATPADGYRFSLWTGACADESVSPCVLATVTMDATVGAEFGCLDFHESAAMGNLAGLKCNTDAGADVNAPDESGRTPLHLAAGEGHLEVVQELLTLGATLNAVDADGKTPLTEAANGDHMEIFDLLAAAGGMCGANEMIANGTCECDSDHRRISESCIHPENRLPEDETTCADAFGGDWVDLSAEHGEGKGVCSGIDINDTFCLAGTVSALPCLGLFNHVRSCNLLGRPALDPWHCGKACAGGKASGARCLE